MGAEVSMHDVHIPKFKAFATLYEIVMIRLDVDNDGYSRPLAAAGRREGRGMVYCTGENAAGMTILFSCAT